jgi:type IV pilus assembly protein PilP
MNPKKQLLMCLLPVMIAGCASDDFADIKQYMATVKAQPSKQIEPIPIYPPYKSFTYSMMAKRGPFEPAVATIERLPGRDPVASNNIKPNGDRVKEYLETFNVEALSLVGHIQKSGVMYALVNDGGGSVHPVSAGDFMGRNHGKITGITETEVRLLEIVSSGSGSWIERPRTLSLRE